MLGIFLCTLVIGQFPTLILFVGLYLKFWGKFGRKVITIYVVSSAIFLYVMFNEIVPVLWYEPPHLPSVFV